MVLNFDEDGISLPNMSYLIPDNSSPQTPKDKTSLEYGTDEKPSVLIFGTDREVRCLLRTLVDIWNYNAEEAETVEEAISIASQKSVDVVLMDTKLKFPDSFAEMRVMQKSFLKHSPFILFSGHIQNDVCLSALAAGAADFFVKPINFDLLEETLKTRIAQSGRMKHSDI